MSNLTIVSGLSAPLTAAISWNNPTQIINNDVLQGPLSIILLRNNDTLKVFQNQAPGALMNYVDTVPFSDSHTYSIIVCCDGINSCVESQSVNIGQLCQYRLVMETTWSGWDGGYLNFGVNPYAVSTPLFSQNVHSFSQYYRGQRTEYLSLPVGWINVEQKGIRGSYTLYDANDSIVFSSSQGLPGTFQWYNNCGLNIPDSVTNLSYTLEGDVLNLTWTNPILTIDSTVLSSLTRDEVSRNEKKIHFASRFSIWIFAPRSTEKAFPARRGGFPRAKGPAKYPYFIISPHCFFRRAPL